MEKITQEIINLINEWCKIYNMKITPNELIEVNRRFGGTLRSVSSLEFAESYCANTESKYKHASAWLRAVLIDHPFSDGNKRTSVYIIARTVGLMENIKMERIIEKIILKNITSLKKIEEMLKNANRIG